MSSPGVCYWESLVSTDAPPGASLQAALLTTYDRPDEKLLAEHLLPVILRTTREPDGEGRERQFFLVELDRALKRLHDKLVIVSSAIRGEEPEVGPREAEAYRWIWRDIRHLTVGSAGKAVQHAKLWLLHWGSPRDGEPECVEVVVSSANLTLNAFRGQIQGAWRTCIPLHPKAAGSRLREWGPLPAFIRSLAKSANAGNRLEPFVELLSRASCPDGVSFVASVPGVHPKRDLKRTPWGIAGLARAAPAGKGRVTVSVLAPYVGSWSMTGLREWCRRIGSDAERLALAWIDEDHPWAREKRWLLPRPSLNALRRAGATLLRLRRAGDDREETDCFHEEHQPADDRWSHAKVYALRRGTSRRVLVTSANFSTAAWGSEAGDGGLAIENFELGVCLEQESWSLFDELPEFDEGVSPATVPAPGKRSAGSITWAQASWDGKNVALACRCEAGLEVRGTVSSGKIESRVSAWRTGPDRKLRSAVVPWKKVAPPDAAIFNCQGDVIRVPVFDDRPRRDRERSPPPEVDEGASQELLDQLLFEQYGGVVPPEEGDGPDGMEGVDKEEHEANASSEADAEDGEGRDGQGDRDDPADAAASDSYAVPAFVLARRHMEVVDNWAQRVSAASRNGRWADEREWWERDAELLIAAFERQAARDGKTAPSDALGAKLAAEELTLRLKHLGKAG